MPTYSEISLTIYNYFYKKSLGFDYFILAFDDDDLHEIASDLSSPEVEILKIIIEEYKLKHFELTCTENPIDLFGVIALQILCATRMGFDNTIKHTEYNLSLQKLLGVQNLQSIYKASQNELWQNAKKYILDLGFKISIPEESTGPWCFVQYPKSQAYLNKNDLARFSAIFTLKAIRVNTVIDRTDFFKILCRNNLSNIRNQLTARAQKLIDDQEINHEILYNQIFAYFLEWEGESYSSIKSDSPKSQIINLFFDEGNGFYLLDNSNKKRSISDSNELYSVLVSNKIITKSTEYLILKRDPGYGDYFEVSRASIGDTIKILIFKQAPFLISCLKTIPGSKEHQLSYQITIFDVHLPLDISNYPYLEEKIILPFKELPLMWLSGIKLTRHSYLLGYGPQFKVKVKCKVYIDDELYNLDEGDIIDSSKLPEGNYTIQPLNGRKINFFICDSSYINESMTYFYGWNLESISPSISNLNVSGLTINDLAVNPVSFSTRDFINLNINKEVKFSSNNQLYKALSKYK